VKLAEFIADASKAVTGATVAAAALVAQGLVSGTVEHWITGGLGAAAAFLAIYSVPRKPKPPAAP
jgi:hypothetical protein